MIPLSVNLMPSAPVAEIMELAVLAESLGCVRCWVYDEGLVTRDVYVTLTAIAGATDSILIGPGITNPYVRHPGATAAAVATLDELSGGRAFVGLGAGGALTLGPLAIVRQRPVTAVGETVNALRTLFAGERLSHDGAVASFSNARLSYGRSDIEIILAGRGPRMVALGAELADGFYLSYIHKAELGATVATLRQQDRPFSITYSTLIATSEQEQEAARAQLSFRLVDSPAEVRERLDLGAADIDRLRHALAEGGPTQAAKLVKPEWLDHFIISGSPGECAAELQRLLSANDIDEFMLAVSDPTTGAEVIERTAHLFAGDQHTSLGE